MKDSIWLAGQLRKGRDKKAEAAVSAASSYVNGEVSLEQLSTQLSDIAGYEVEFEKHSNNCIWHSAATEPHYKVWMDGTKDRPRFGVVFTEAKK